MNNFDKNKVKLQNVILMIAKEIVKLCDENNIPYFINGGTQLGAIRHKGFIPWDDDFDIGMLRADYEKFLKVCEEQLDYNKYFLQTEDTEKYYAFNFAKIQLKGTCIIEDFSKNVQIEHGIFVDIFPYDNIPDKAMKRRFFFMYNHILKNLLWIKCGYGDDTQKNAISYKCMLFISHFFSLERLKKKRKQLMNQYNNQITKNCITSDYPGDILKNEWFEDFVKYKFEDVEFLGFKKYDEYLKNLYGDYMKIPKESDRVTHSNYDIDFGVYDSLLEE